MGGAESRGKGRAATRSPHSPPEGPRGNSNRAHRKTNGGQTMRRHDAGYPSATRTARKLSRWNPVRLADENTPEQLHELRESITNDPVNANPAHASGLSIYLHTPEARRKLDAIAWAVTHQIAARRAAQ